MAETHAQLHISVNDLLSYTAWERESWLAQLRKHGDPVLKISAGPHDDGRFPAVGDLVRHMFSAEKGYIDRLSGRPLTDTASIPNNNLDMLFQFGQHSRRDLEGLIHTFPAQEWEASKEFEIGEQVMRATPRKIVTHVLMHEIRHWAQIATLLRLNGYAVENTISYLAPRWGNRLSGRVRGAATAYSHRALRPASLPLRLSNSIKWEWPRLLGAIQIWVRTTPCNGFSISSVRSV